MKKIVLSLVVLLTFTFSLSAKQETATWSSKSNKLSDTEYELIFTAGIIPNYHMYSISNTGDGPMPISIKYDEASGYELIGDVEIRSKEYEEFDEMFDMDVKFFDGEAILAQKVKLTGDKANVKGTIEFQTCGENQCFLGEANFEFNLSSATAVVTSAETKEEGKSESLWAFFFIAFGGGILGFLMPCVFPMVPMTISFFMGGSEKKSAGAIKGLIFGISVTSIYTLVGVIVGLIQSAAFADILSNHWIPNLIFFLLFFIFALSFFGLFEITLPSALANRADRQADKGGYLASFFLAVVLTIVSFSCTGPIVGGILAEAVTGGLALKPIIGMFGFGLGLSLPFIILSFSPALMKKLPKSGGWMNAVKIFFAFILLIFGMKFLTVVDIDLGFNIITRDVFIAIWIVLFVLLGMYLLGKIKFSHDSDLQHVGVFRLFLAIASFTFAVYLVPGLFGAPLAAVSGFMPSQDKQVFDLPREISESTQITDDVLPKLAAHMTNAMVDAVDRKDEISIQPKNIIPATGGVKYADFLHLPTGIKGYFDLKQGLEAAKEQNKPVLLDFKGHRCANCKKMDKEVFADKRVIDYINENFIIIGLYVDDETELPQSEWIKGSDGKDRKTIGKINREYQLAKFKQISQPYFTIIDHSENAIIDGVGYMSSPDKFLEWLKKGVDTYKK